LFTVPLPAIIGRIELIIFSAMELLKRLTLSEVFFTGSFTPGPCVATLLLRTYPGGVTAGNCEAYPIELFTSTPDTVAVVFPTGKPEIDTTELLTGIPEIETPVVLAGT
jgi:hypothetical protein